MKLCTKAHAKVNLALEVLFKRQDGYHEISSVMHSLELHDRIFIDFLDENRITITSDSPFVPVDNDNTAYKAAKLLKEKYDVPCGLSIHIEKNIPQGAGLGGGSSDAASVIKLLNKKLALNMNNQNMIDLALKIGADVPFCLNGGAAYLRGVGEIVEKLEPLSQFPVVLVKPDFDVVTKKAYEKWDDQGNDNLNSNSECEKLKELMFIAREKNYWKDNLGNLVYNSFTSIISKEYKEVQRLIDVLSHKGAFACGMSGSGPTIFAVFEDDRALEMVLGDIKKMGFSSIVTRLAPVV